MDMRMQLTEYRAFAVILNTGLDQILLLFDPAAQSFYCPAISFGGDEAPPLFAAAANAKEKTGAKEIYPFCSEVLSQAADALVFGFICPDAVKNEENMAARWLPLETLPQSVKDQRLLRLLETAIARMQSMDRKSIFAALPGLLLPWYRENARELPWREDKDPYHVWLSEIMLQQTRVDTVIGYYLRFLAALPSVFDLAAADEEKVLKLWEGLGYYSRARNLMKCAKIVADHYQGQFPADLDRLSALPGIGGYTAGAIASICFDLPAPAVDGNVLRIITRMTENFRSIDQDGTKKEIVRALAGVYPEGFCGDFTQSLIELGATVCLPNSAPLCGKCPANDVCMAFKNGSYPFLPVRKEKKPRKMVEMTVFILKSGGKVALRKRMAAGVLNGLWEFPNIESPPDDARVKEKLAELAGHGAVIQNIVRGKHIFTHIEWHMTCYFMAAAAPFGEDAWIDKTALKKEIALPTAFRKFWESYAEERTLLDFTI